jgi:hypothetical protein
MSDSKVRLSTGVLGRTRAGWIRKPERDPVKLEVIERVPEEVRMRALHRGGTYFLYLDLTGQQRHHCTCLDFCEYAGRCWRRLDPYCRHVVAAVLKEKRPEMLLAFLAGKR